LFEAVKLLKPYGAGIGFLVKMPIPGLPLVYVRRIEPDVEAFLAHYREHGGVDA
jgi:hypothetical protein